MKSGVYFLTLVFVLMSASFVSAGLLCDWFGVNCDSDLKGELFQEGLGEGVVNAVLKHHYKFDNDFVDSWEFGVL